jgi:hypothetical protein
LAARFFPFKILIALYAIDFIIARRIILPDDMDDVLRINVYKGIKGIPRVPGQPFWASSIRPKPTERKGIAPELEMPLRNVG